MIDRLRKSLAFVQIQANQDGNDFGVSPTDWLKSVYLVQFCFKLVVVCNDSIVNQSDSVLMVEMRVSVYVSFVTVGGPSRMTNSNAVIVSGSSFYCHAFDAIASKPV